MGYRLRAGELAYGGRLLGKCPETDLPGLRERVSAREHDFTRDCHGITFRLVCFDCYDKVMGKGYDGAYYSEADECIEEDY